MAKVPAKPTALDCIPQGSRACIPSAYAGAVTGLELKRSLGSSVFNEIAAWRTRWVQGDPNTLVQTAEGLAICYSLILKSALPPPLLVEKLKSLACLQLFESKGRACHVTVIDFAGHAELAVVIPAERAQALGFERVAFSTSPHA